jgi:2'-5' RNA ligase
VGIALSLRLFVAVWPPPEIMTALHDLRRPDTAGVRWTTFDQWHVTLLFLGPVDDPDPVVAALDVALDRWPGPVVARIGPCVERLGREVLCLPIAGLEDLAGAVNRALGPLVPPSKTRDRDLARSFRGHLTLARGRRGADLRPLAGEGLDESWLVDQVTLVASTLRPSGATYEVIGRRPLGS